MAHDVDRTHTLPLVGQLVLDTEADSDKESLAVVLEVHPDTPASERYIPSIGKTVADVNPDYPPDAPVVSIAFAEDLENNIYNWRDIPNNELMEVVRSNNIRVYDYPISRLELLSVKGNQEDGNDNVTVDTDESKSPESDTDSLGQKTKRFDLTTVPDNLPLDGSGDESYVRRRGEYLRRVTDLREPLPKALAYREIGYSSSGIAKKLDTTEPTVESWMEEIAEEYGKEALETRPQSEPHPVLE